MRLGSRIKDPDDTIDYDVDFGRYLPDGDSVQSATASSDDPTLVVESVSVSDSVVKVWLSGGEDGQHYSVDVSATSAAGRTKSVCFTIRVRNC